MVVLWDLNVPDEGEVVAKIENSVYALKYLANEKSLFVGDNHQGIHKVDLESKKEIASLSLGNHQIFSIEEVGSNLWVALSNGEVVVLDKDLKILNRVRYSSDRIRDIEVLEGRLSVASSDNVIRIIDPKTMKVTQELRGHKNSVFGAKFHPSGKYMASVSRDAHINIWDANEAYLLRESIAAHLYSINDLAFIKDGRYFVTGSMDKSIKLWDAYNFRLLKVLDKHRHAGHGNSVNKLLWMNYHDLLVSCSDDRSISVWEINFAEEKKE